MTYTYLLVCLSHQVNIVHLFQVALHIVREIKQSLIKQLKREQLWAWLLRVSKKFIMCSIIYYAYKLAENQEDS